MRRCRLYLPHLLTVITPAEIPDEYDNPTPRLDYGPTAPRRRIRGLVQPRTGTDHTEPGRQAITGTWWAFTLDPIHAREQVELDGRLYKVDGEPELWMPRPGHVHFETVLTHVEG